MKCWLAFAVLWQ